VNAGEREPSNSRCEDDNSADIDSHWVFHHD
jgi:hypothetical protein